MTLANVICDATFRGVELHFLPADGSVEVFAILKRPEREWAYAVSVPYERIARFAGDLVAVEAQRLVERVERMAAE